MKIKCLTGVWGVVVTSLLATLGVAASGPVVSKSAGDLEKTTSALLGLPDETDVKAPIDFGTVIAAKSLTKTAKSLNSAAIGAKVAPNDIPIGTNTANVTGVFGPAVTWPIIPIHAVVLPDGRVMNYGTNQKGAQGAQLVYDIWTPTLGTGTDAHLVLPNTTSSDIFCSAQSVQVSGEVLVSGGDLTINGQRNFARNNTNIFSPVANTLTANTPMNFARWYGSLVPMPNGQFVTFGGYQNATTLTPVQPSTTPEIYDPGSHSWTALPGATSAAAFGVFNNDWYYPRAFVAPGGLIFIMSNDGPLYSVSTTGTGSITQYSVKAPPGEADLPTIPFAPGKLLSLRQNQVVAIIDYSGAVPVVTKTNPIDQPRYWANGTILANGEVLVTGGSSVKNVLTGVDYTAEIWNPATGQWTAGASAAKPRLYHSSALLLPDATVFTGGGGAPGPVANLNAEIYYPPYLYASDGTAAVRPALSLASPLTVAPGATLGAMVGAADTIAQLTFVRTGSSTHSTNSDQRFFNLPFSQDGPSLTSVLPSDPTVLLPGFYMLFAINNAGVPSVAIIVLVS